LVWDLIWYCVGRCTNGNQNNVRLINENRSFENPWNIINAFPSHLLHFISSVLVVMSCWKKRFQHHQPDVMSFLWICKFVRMFCFVQQISLLIPLWILMKFLLLARMPVTVQCSDVESQKSKEKSFIFHPLTHLYTLKTWWKCFCEMDLMSVYEEWKENERNDSKIIMTSDFFLWMKMEWERVSEKRLSNSSHRNRNVFHNLCSNSTSSSSLYTQILKRHVKVTLTHCTSKSFVTWRSHHSVSVQTLDENISTFITHNFTLKFKCQTTSNSEC
jgi:hypothetical protein